MIAVGLDEARRIAGEMASRKKACPCGAVCCLVCGNEEGQRQGSGGTHCPRCGKRLG